ncbi:S-adenosylmethionine:tRNA ribosyltransferase-isomerase [Streptomyces hypolithicus]
MDDRIVVRVPDELSARVPAEERGAGRDDVRLLLSRGTEVTHHAFRELTGLLRAGDVLVVNTSATLAAAVDGRVGLETGSAVGSRVVVHFSTRGDDGRWAVELRSGVGAGVASAEAHEPPYPERFAVPASTARLVNAARAEGGHIVAVGTTAVRALESAAGPGGVVRARSGWTDLVITPERGVRAVDGLLTGLHEPEASHLLMLEAVAGRAALRGAYAEALSHLYLWHEFGDVHLILPAEGTHAEHRGRNDW